MPGSWKASLHFTPTRGHSQPKYLLQMRTNFTSPDPHNPGPFFVYSDEVFIIAASYTVSPQFDVLCVGARRDVCCAFRRRPARISAICEEHGRKTHHTRADLSVDLRADSGMGLDGWWQGLRQYHLPANEDGSAPIDVDRPCDQASSMTEQAVRMRYGVGLSAVQVLREERYYLHPVLVLYPIPTRIGSIEWIRLELKWHWTCEWIPFACPVPLQLEHDASRGEFSLDVEECSKQMASIYSSNLRDQKCCSGDAVEHRSGPQMSGQTYRQRKIRVIFDLSTAASAHAGSGRPIEEHWEEEEGCQSLARAS
ncbi:hypothetical protein B0H10DRAFT_1961391 [Mycena sp. CBHHK59/15]|nr:hypothetical protein B0H10DRAFT_1961391 [Mycena sp. CBHHK59/15]